jgi:MtfA peptidase
VNVNRFGRLLFSGLNRVFAPRRGRRPALEASFPPAWKHYLEVQSEHYRRLPSAYRTEFHHQVQAFLEEKRITGVEMSVSDELRLLIAASAVTLTVGWPGYQWDRLTEVLVYPADFDRDYRFGGTDLSGQAHPWGVVILSAPTLEWSFAESGGNFHLGYHEFAHLLDSSQSGGVPSYLSDESMRNWMSIIEREETRLRAGDSRLSPYGLASPAELFAVAVEAFFQIPVAVMTSHGELYSFLSSYFGQDPAAWSGVRA